MKADCYNDTYHSDSHFVPFFVLNFKLHTNYLHTPLASSRVCSSVSIFGQKIGGSRAGEGTAKSNGTDGKDAGSNLWERIKDP